MSAARALAILLPSLLLLVAPARAQEWHEAYRDGVKALDQGQPARAVGLLEYAVSRRPQPGRDIITYGTNVERQYYPYLKLAEAYLRLRDVGGARSALKRSENWAREPAEERRRLAAQVDALAAAAATPAPAPPSPAATAPPTTVAAAPPVPTAPVTAVPETPRPASGAHVEHPPERREAETPRRDPPAAAANPPSPRAAPVAEASASAVLDIVSQPPGASVYVDDELIGATDPEWGRLVRSGLTPAAHRVRLSLAGFQDLTETVDLAAGRVELRRRLVAAPAATAATGASRRFLLVGAVALVLLGLTAWALRSSPPASVPAPTPGRGHPFDPSAPTPPRPTPPRLTPPRPTPPRLTPPGMGSPGVHRGADGLEYFGDYRLVEPLGRGGMASVYRVERGSEVYALKRPLPAFLDEPEFLERFLREAEIGRTLHHPNIVRILERGAVEGVPFFTMELVPGETLQALLLRHGAMPPRAATQAVVQIAEALDYAHLKGVVHRDLKPSNVMVLPDGALKVMDYGIARARRFDGLTVTGAFLGSPEYVAPETIEGKGADVRSDLYSLGVIFYETLAGRRPFLADAPFAILQKHLTEVPVAPSARQASVPAELDRIVLRLLSKAPDQRYAGAEELVLDLRDFLNRAT
jgi:protein kinase-like protein/PEGA domain-containing protein